MTAFNHISQKVSETLSYEANWCLIIKLVKKNSSSGSS